MGVFIIAEAGVNHNGRLELAREMIGAAAAAGADAVKFQTFRAEELIVPTAPKAAYQIANTGRDGSQLELLRGVELPPDAFRELADCCRRRNIDFLSTPFDRDSADLLDDLGMSSFKIPSGELTNKPLLQHIASKAKPILLSTGMSYLEEVAAAVGWIVETWTRMGASSRSLTLLHCVSSYPAPVEEVNLNAMRTLEETFRLPVGYSDHTMGIEMPIAAVALGATVIEKHFTLSRDSSGPDHLASLEPPEFAAMVRAIRNVEEALGDGIKRPSPSELETRTLARRSVVSARAIKKGEVLSSDDLAVRRPGAGIPPEQFHQVVGRRARRDIASGTVIGWQDLADGS